MYFDLDSRRTMGGKFIQGFAQYAKRVSRICAVSGDALGLSFIVDGKGVSFNECKIRVDLERKVMEFQVVRLAWGEDDSPGEWYRTNELLEELNRTFTVQNPFYSRQNGWVEASINCFDDFVIRMPPLNEFCEMVINSMVTTIKDI